MTVSRERRNALLILAALIVGGLIVGAFASDAAGWVYVAAAVAVIAYLAMKAARGPSV